MRNPNNLLSKNTFSIQKNLKETHVTESAIQISTTKKFQHTFNIQKIQNLHTNINIHSTSKNTFNIQISTAIQNLQYIQHTKKFLQYKSTPTKISAALKISAIHNFCCKNKFLLHWKFSAASKQNSVNTKQRVATAASNKTQ